jgi:flagellar hook-basal body complex protein FliE
MDPLSSIQFSVSPELRAVRLPALADELAAPKFGAGGGVAEALHSGPASGGFESALGRFVSEVNSKQVEAKEAVAGLLNGQQVSLHQAVIAMEEASVSFQLMVEVRNKLLESYQELMRMQV